MTLWALAQGLPSLRAGCRVGSSSGFLCARHTGPRGVGFCWTVRKDLGVQSFTRASLRSVPRASETRQDPAQQASSLLQPPRPPWGSAGRFLQGRVLVSKMETIATSSKGFRMNRCLQNVQGFAILCIGAEAQVQGQLGFR